MLVSSIPSIRDFEGEYPNQGPITFNVFSVRNTHTIQFQINVLFPPYLQFNNLALSIMILYQWTVQLVSNNLLLIILMFSHDSKRLLIWKQTFFPNHVHFLKILAYIYYKFMAAGIIAPNASTILYRGCLMLFPLTHIRLWKSCALNQLSLPEAI
jgi:hypothetical protein